MPTNLTPEQILAIQQYMAGPYGTGPIDGRGYYVDESGVAYQPSMREGGGMESIFGYDPSKTRPGDSYSGYDAGGAYTGEGQFKDMGPDGLLAGMLSDPAFYAFLASAGAMGFGLPGMTGGESAAISGPGISTVNGMTTFGVVDPTIAWGAGAGGAAGGAAGAAAAGGGGSGGGSLGTMGTLSPMSTAGLEALTPMAVGSGLGGLLGPAATLLGGLAGAQGQDTSQTQTKKTDPRLDPYIFGNNDMPGALQYAYGLLSKQMAPGYMQGYEDMRSVGQGLLSQPVAGNGFLKFFPGR